jgi:hypothetical protein
MHPDVIFARSENVISSMLNIYYGIVKLCFSVGVIHYQCKQATMRANEWRTKGALTSKSTHVKSKAV